MLIPDRMLFQSPNREPNWITCNSHSSFSSRKLTEPERNGVKMRKFACLLTLLVMLGCSQDLIKEEASEKSEAEVDSVSSVQTITWKKDGVQMALIPAGNFEMGDHFNEGYTNELPVHKVELDAFYIDTHEVTVRQYKKFVAETGRQALFRWVSTYAPTDRHPVIGVSWNDATAYAKWAGKRLPTEAEWEYAARGGLVGKRCSWGDKIAPDDTNWGSNYCQPVGRFEANGYGLYDMAGNVFEWCLDWYDEDYYKHSPTRNPTGPNSGKYRVLRGGSCYVVHDPRVALRSISSPNIRNNHYGFRCVADIE